MSPRAYGARTLLRNLALAVALLAAAPAAAEVRILAFGDSLTQGYGLPQEAGLVPQLQAWLRGNGAGDATVINAGVSGDTTTGGLNRIAWALDDDVDAVIVALGGNDLLRGIEPGLTRANLDGILAEVVARDLPVLLAGLPAPPNFGPDYQRAFAAIFPELAEEHDALLYPSLLEALGEPGDPAALGRMMQPDGIHPSAAGVEAIVADLGPLVLELIGRAR